MERLVIFFLIFYVPLFFLFIACWMFLPVRNVVKKIIDKMDKESEKTK